MINVAATEKVEAPTTHLFVESSLPSFPGKVPIKIHVGQFYKGLPPFMGGGEPDPAGLVMEVTDSKGDPTVDAGPIHLTREDVEQLHSQLGAWLEGKWGVDRVEAMA